MNPRPRKSIALLAAAAFCCVLLAPLLPGWQSAAVAQETTARDPLDAEIERLLARDDSTAGQVQAFSRGTELWDQAMNRVYGELMKQLSREGREALRVSQRAWLAWRDAQEGLIQETYGRAQGTMYRPMAVAHAMETVKARTLQLRRYLEIVEESR